MQRLFLGAPAPAMGEDRDEVTHGATGHKQGRLLPSHGRHLQGKGTGSQGQEDRDEVTHGAIGDKQGPLLTSQGCHLQGKGTVSQDQEDRDEVAHRATGDEQGRLLPCHGSHLHGTSMDTGLEFERDEARGWEQPVRLPCQPQLPAACYSKGEEDIVPPGPSQRLLFLPPEGPSR